MNKELDAVALSIRSLSIDAIEKANSGHPGLPLGAAELATALYAKILRHNPKNPQWVDRDRFILSAGHGSMLLYAALHLAGYDLSLDDIRSFRQIGSRCAGHPEYGLTPGVEATTGPLGQGISTAVGMAIAEAMLAARFNTEEYRIVDHYTYALVGEGCLMEGVSSEASSLAGTLKLGKLIVYYDKNNITIDGSTDIAFTEDVTKRYEAYGWQVLHGSMYSYSDIEKLTAEAKKDPRPSLITERRSVKRSWRRQRRRWGLILQNSSLSPPKPTVILKSGKRNSLKRKLTGTAALPRGAPPIPNGAKNGIEALYKAVLTKPYSTALPILSLKKMR